MSDQFEPGVATVALQRETVSAPPHRVFAKLARARQWHQWLTAANLVSTAREEELQSEDTFTYTASSIVPGFIDSLVLDAEPGQVRCLLATQKEGNYMSHCITDGSKHMISSVSGYTIRACTNIDLLCIGSIACNFLWGLASRSRSA